MRARTFFALLLILTMLLNDAVVAFADVSSSSAVTSSNVVGGISSPSESDLSHLVFTATSPMMPVLVAPSANGYGGVATPFVVTTGLGAGIELIVDGVVVPSAHIGKREVVRATGATTYTFFGVGLVPGPNDVVITSLGANGARLGTIRCVVYGRGPAVSFKGSLVGSLRADGVTPAIFRVVALDSWNHPAMSGFGVKVSVLSGDVHLGGVSSAVPYAPPTGMEPSVVLPSAPSSLSAPEVLASSTPGGFAPQGQNAEIGTPSQAAFQALTDPDGTVDVPIMPGLRSGIAVLRVESEDGSVSYDARVSISAYVRSPIVTGLVTGGVGAVPGDPGTDATAPYEANSRRGRIALFATGAVSNDVSATVAYDTAGVLDQSGSTGSFDENPDARPYGTYGDASVRRADALSSNHLYARVNRGQSSATYGEFQAQSGDDSPGSLGGLNLLLNGAHLDLVSKSARLELFRASSGVAYARDVFTPTGLATISGNLHPNVVVGSDSVTLVSIDRSKGYVISESTLTRDVDYVLDYGSGILRFINPPLAFDVNFNPQQVLVEYEYEGSGGSLVSGGRASVFIGKVRVGAGYANDATGNGNVSIFGQNVSAPIPGGTARFEHLSTSGLLGDQIPSIGSQVSSGGTAGDAMRVSALGSLGVSRYDFSYQTTSAGFDDPFGGISSPGLTSLRLALTRPISHGDLSLSYDGEQNALGGSRSSQSDVSLRMHRKFGSRLKTTMALTRQTSAANGISAPVGFLQAGQVTNPTDLAPLPLPVASPSAVGVASVTQGELGATYALSPAVEVSVDRIADLGGSVASSLSQPAQTSAQVSVGLGKTGRAYVRELVTDQPTQTFASSTAVLAAAAGATHVMQIGVEREVGPATTIDTQYSVQRTGSVSDIYSAVGVKERVFASKSLRGDVVVQRADAAGSGASGFMQYGATLSYERGTRFRSSASYQIRTGAIPGSTLALGFVGYLGSGFSLLGSANDALAVGQSTADDRLSLAYRPNDDDRSSMLFGYERLEGSGAVLGERTNVLSLDVLHRPSRWLEATARFAYKMDGDSYYAARTMLGGFRLVQRVSSRVDVAGEVRASGAVGVVGSSVAGYALETGYRVGDGFRIAGGYNFQQTPDFSLAAPPRVKGFYVTVTSVVDSLFGFGRANR